MNKQYHFCETSRNHENQKHLWNAIAGFSIRAGGRQNSPAISRELATYFSLEITPFFWEIVNAQTRNVFK